MTVATARRIGLPAVLAAQLLTALADNALLIVAIALLEARHAPDWATPSLRVAFYAAYVLLAPLAGALADRWPKGALMAGVNLLKLAGALGLLAGAHPLLVFALIGLGACAYAPARYGILPALRSGPGLLRANAMMEIVTIAAILGGTLLGSRLVHGDALQRACILLALLYGAAAVASLGSLGVDDRRDASPPFSAALGRLLGDPAARVSLAITCLFWAAAAVLQFLLIDWSRSRLGLDLARAALLPAALAVGMVAGAFAAGQAPGAATGRGAMPLALALGGAIALLPALSSITAVAALLLAAGVLAGLLLVPMNASLQARGAALMGAGQAVAVQNFLENGLSLVLLALYGCAVAAGLAAATMLVGLGALLALLVLIAVLPGQRRGARP